MGRAIPLEVWVRYDALRKQGASQALAARTVGIDANTAGRREKNKRKKDGAVHAAVIADAKLAAPKADEGKLSDDARRALIDFEFFRLRYFGHVSTPWQVDAANRMVGWLESEDKEYVVVNCPPGAGKALALDTPILTTQGWSTMKSLEVGDFVFGADGRPTRVLAKSEVFYDHDCYEVATDDGASVIADAEHLWSVRLHGHGQYGNWSLKTDYAGKRGPKPSPDGRHVHTTEFLAKKRSKRPQLQIAAPLQLPAANLPLDPYVLGAWLGDGSSATAQLTCHSDDAPHFTAEFERAGFRVTRAVTNTAVSLRLSRAENVTCYRGHPTNRSANGNCRDCHALSERLRRRGLPMPAKSDPTPTEVLRQMHLLNNKHVPEVYFGANAEQRLALLQGLVDTDGHVGPNGHIEFCSTSLRLAEGVQRLVRGLGAKCSLNIGRATLNGKDCGPKYRVMFYLADAARLPRKAERCRNGARTPSRYLTVTPVESVPTQCIVVDAPDHLFLAGEGLLVTHNSTLFTHDIPAWVLVRDRSARILIGSRTERQARQYVGRLKTTMERTHPPTASDIDKRKGLAQDAVATLTGDFGRFKPTNPDIWRSEEFTVAQVNDIASSDKERSVSAYGMDGGFLGGRYDVCVWDDIVDKRSMRTAESRETLINMWETEAETRLEPGGLMILQGQRMRGDDLYRHALDMRAGDPDDYDEGEVRPAKYRHVLYQAHDDEHCKMLHAKTDRPWDGTPEGGCLLDPVRMDWRTLKTLQAHRAERYLVMYQQLDVDPANALVDPLWVSGGCVDGVDFPGCWDKERGLCELPKGIDRSGLISVATADPSPTKFWAIIWWIYDPKTEQRFLMDLVRQAMDAPDFLDRDFHTGEFTGVMEDWQVRSEALGLPIQTWVVEANAAQRFMLQYEHFRHWRIKRGVDVIPHQTHINKHDTDYGVQTMAPHWRHGRVRLPGKLHNAGRIAALKLVDEVTRWEPGGGGGGTDDCVMAAWFFEYSLPRIYTPNVKAPQMHRPWAQMGRGLSDRRLEVVA